MIEPDCGLIRGLGLFFFVQKILRCVVFFYDYLSTPDRDGASPNSNPKYQTCLIFTTLDQAASDAIPAIANESELALPTGCCIYISLWITFCIIEYVTNKRTLNLDASFNR